MADHNSGSARGYQTGFAQLAAMVTFELANR